jgi:hypothetical protein
MSDERSTSESTEEMSEEALDNVAGGIIIVGGSFLLPAVQRNWASLVIPTDPVRKALPGDPC